MKFVNVLMAWVLFASYSGKGLMDKLNSLPKETVDTAKVQISTNKMYPNYIIYWDDQ